MAMKRRMKVATPEEFIARLKEPRKGEILALHELIRKTAPALEPHICSGMLGYGRYHYKYPSGREGDWFRVGLGSNKSSISIHACAADHRGYVAERYRSRLPKAEIGKTCVRFKKLGDVDLQVIQEIIKETATLGFSS